MLLGRRADTPVPDRVLCVVDATNLERNLYLASQALALGIPAVVALTLSDVAVARGIDMAWALPEMQLPNKNLKWRAQKTASGTDVIAFLQSTDLRPFNAKTPPPKTQAFFEIVDSNRSPEDAELADTLERCSQLPWAEAVRLVARLVPRAKAVAKPGRTKSKTKGRGR